MTEITFDGYHLPTLAKVCRELNSPSDGALAEFVWRLSNSPAMPIMLAAEFLRSAGYVPFKGYPLQRRRSESRAPLSLAACSEEL